MEQLSLVDTELDKKTRKAVEKLLSGYRNLDAIIESMEQDLPEQKMTVNYEASESQRNTKPSSQVENIVMIRDKIAQKKIAKAKLDRIYNSLREVQQQIWKIRYIDGRFDDITIGELNISRRQYYREKTALMKIVAEVFYLI